MCSAFDSSSLKDILVFVSLPPPDVTDSGDEEAAKEKNDSSPPELRFNGSLNSSLFHGLPRLYATGSSEDQSATMARLSAAAMGAAMGPAGVWPGTGIPPGFNPFTCLPFPTSSFPFFNPLTFHPLEHLSAMRPPSSSLSSSGSSVGSAAGGPASSQIAGPSIGVNLSHKIYGNNGKLDAQPLGDSINQESRHEKEDGVEESVGKSRRCSQE